MPVDGYGFPSGGAVLIAVKKGTQNGTSYSQATTTYVDVDAANLALSILIPIGQKLTVLAVVPFNFTAGNVTPMARIVDGTTAIAEGSIGAAAGMWFPVPYMGEVNGDGLTHTIKLQFAASAGSAIIRNEAPSTTTSPANGWPVMLFWMGPAS